MSERRHPLLKEVLDEVDTPMFNSGMKRSGLDKQPDTSAAHRAAHRGFYAGKRAVLDSMVSPIDAMAAALGVKVAGNHDTEHWLMGQSFRPEDAIELYPELDLPRCLRKELALLPGTMTAESMEPTVPAWIAHHTADIVRRQPGVSEPELFALLGERSQLSEGALVLTQTLAVDQIAVYVGVAAAARRITQDYQEAGLSTEVPGGQTEVLNQVFFGVNHPIAEGPLQKEPLPELTSVGTAGQDLTCDW